MGFREASSDVTQSRKFHGTLVVFMLSKISFRAQFWPPSMSQSKTARRLLWELLRGTGSTQAPQDGGAGTDEAKEDGAAGDAEPASKEAAEDSGARERKSEEEGRWFRRSRCRRWGCRR
ncbi:hypothetical protein MRX96_031409 [Rhipicephalus microplus]